MPDKASRIAELQKDVAMNNTDGIAALKHDLAAIAMDVSPQDYRDIIDSFNKAQDAQSKDLPKLQITFNDTDGDGKLGSAGDTIKTASIDFWGNNDGNLLGGVDVFSVDNINAIKNFNQNFDKQHPELSGALTALEAHGMQPTDQQKFREVWNYLKAHNGADQMGVLIDAYKNVSDQSGGVLATIGVQTNPDGSPYLVFQNGVALPIVGFPNNPIQQAAMAPLGLTGDLVGAYQMGVDDSFEH